MYDNNKKPIGGMPSPIPGIAPEIAGAPVTPPSSGDGTVKSKMSGTPVDKASLPPPVSADIAGMPQAGGQVEVVKKPDDGKEQLPELSPEQQQLHDSVAGLDSNIKTVRDWLAAEEHKPETKEQRARRERREKSKKIIAAVSDGLASLGNLFFAANYAPSSYDPSTMSHTGAVARRIEELKQERKRRHDEYLKMSILLGDLETKRAAVLREVEQHQEKIKAARRKAESDAELQPLLKFIKEQEGLRELYLANKAGYDATVSQYEAINKPEAIRLENEYTKSGIRQRNASAKSSLASAKSSLASAKNSLASAEEHNRSNRAEYAAEGADGKTRYYHDEDAAKDYERRQKTYNPANWGDNVVEVTTEKSPKGNVRKTVTKSKKEPAKGDGYSGNSRGY